MGAYISLQHESKNDEPTATEKSLEFTPSQPLRGKRILEIDPRSPSDFFSRTPIIVNKTPDIQCYKMIRSVTENIPSPVIKDPRSPTTEFTRTPINPCNPSPVTVRHRVITAQTVSDHAQEPDFTEPSSICDSDTSSLTLSYRNLSGQPTTSLESLESAICLDRGHQLCCEKNASPDADVNPDDLLPSPSDLDVVSGHEDDEGYEDMDVSPQSLDNKAINKVKLTDEGTPKLQAISRSIVLKPKILALTPAFNRSPLSTVQNSPRVLSQRNIKQSYGDNPALINSVRIDKENIH